ncbi:MAG: type II secretion system F family protein [Betaproteobacteria bacterium]
MPVFRYKAVNGAGATVQGEFDALQETAVVEWLRESALMPLKIELAKGGGSGVAAGAAGAAAPVRKSLFSRKRVTQEQLLNLTRELATLLRAGLPLDRALEILINLSTELAPRALMQQIRDDVRGGASLSQALEKSGGVFTRFYVNIVRAGEAGGALAAVMARLSEFMERAKELRETVRSALMYPALLLFVAVSSIMLLLIKVVPQFEPIFAQSGKALPVPTQIVIGAGRFATQYWWMILLGIVVIGYWWRWQMARKTSRFKWDGRFLKLPIFGDLINKIETARFARTLSTLLGNGVSLLGALSIVRETMNNSVLAGALDGVIVKLREGRGLSQPLRETGVYPQLAVQLIMVGEETGRLEDMLGRVADIYDNESQRAVKRMLGILEPVLILIMAGLIAMVILSILLGIFSINDLADLS